MPNKVLFGPEQIASSSILGLMKVGSGLGINSNNQVYVQAASSSQIKAGTEVNKPITPLYQEEAVFYGLAKAAGDITQSNSSLSVGTYTGDAIHAISKMLGYLHNSYIVSTETGDTAYFPWDVGDVFIWDGGLVKVTAAIATGDTISKTGNNANVTPTQLVSLFPHEIKLNGTSIVDNTGVATIPLASTTTYGAVKINSWNGITLDSTTNTLKIRPAGQDMVKNGTNNECPICPNEINRAAFYGLAKAAGDSTQSASSNAVGVYTDNAKTAIQGMLSVASTNNPVLTGSFSHNRKANTTVGSVSAVIGYDNAAEGSGAIAIGYNNIAYAQGSITLGTNNIIYGDGAVAIGYKNIAQYQSSFVFGQYNAIDTITDWASNVEYNVGDLVYNNAYVLECLTAHTSGSTIDYSKWTMVLKYLFVIGNGNQENTRSNALAVSIEGDLRLKNNLYINCNADSSGGTKLVGLPTVTSNDDGKVLRVIDGQWTVAAAPGGSGSVASANGVSF